MYNENIHPIILTILDGWGYSENIKGNAIKLANTSNIDEIWRKYPHSLLNASGENVGLPKNQMGNSEVGHTTIGSGRVINQDLVRIKKSIDDGDFFNSETIHQLCKKITKKSSKLHIVGLCSDGGVHSHVDHLKALIKIISKYESETCLHLITDGRDTSPQIAAKFLNIIDGEIKRNNNINICTISGRYYSMDRDCRWSRTEKAYKVLTENKEIVQSDNFEEIINNFYEIGISDEFIPPTRVREGKISNNDGVLFFNFRPDRIRQLIQSLAKPNFKGFVTRKINNLLFTTFTEYDSTLNFPIVFPHINQKNFLGQVISNHNIRQLRLAETEKYAHVTYFFNGGIEEPFPGEDRELIPSPRIDTYDLKPAMSAYEITESIMNAIDKNIYDLIIVNYANPDMVGHTGNLEATINAVEVVDDCMKTLFNKVTNVQGTLIITADHGNADYMIDDRNRPCKSHSTNLVPFIIVENSDDKKYTLKSEGNLADIAPTILELLDINIPKEMNGKSLIKNLTTLNKKIDHD
uniref:2,3-bisphosphoglycerate-independent phosphoglycerate mutase n=1 Tax=Pleurostichidium falkenbergii TaxID=121064 RepID=A0A4D6UY80_9FLOR|nr:Phosphoglycerate mutase [Pleurostichidium falkenbergii]QCH39608.1 Phosphoglycerate mutase [Pleurostichidium falkenbergii]